MIGVISIIIILSSILASIVIMIYPYVKTNKREE
jgi:hypothetical protein